MASPAFAPEDLARVVAKLPGKSTKKDETAHAILEALYTAGLLNDYNFNRLVFDTRTTTHERDLGNGITAEHNNDTLVALAFEPDAVLEVEA